jgi:hypothetical protein
MSRLPRLRTVLGQPSWELKGSHVRACLTRLGGHLGPVEFRLGRKVVAPFSVAPWAGEKLPPGLPPLLIALRGDFFCAPFGGNGTPFRGERHPPHGETANAVWQATGVEASAGRRTLQATLPLTVRRGRVDKFLSVVDGETVVYQRHVISGARGPLSIGHHAMLRFPDAAGSGVVSTSRFVRAQVLPLPFEQPEARGYSALRTGARFTRLDRAPLATGGTTDLSVYPARRGFDDLVMLTADHRLPFAWSAVTFADEGYVWFALRDPRVLRHTVLWISNGGRHYAPWNGRHVNVLGIEEATGYFHLGLAESARPNPISRAGLPTTVRLDPKRPTDVRYVVGVAAIPRGFDRVADIWSAAGGVELRAASGRRVKAKLDLGFLRV